MVQDITPPDRVSHQHRWFFLQTRTEMVEHAENGEMHGYIEKLEYAYFVCNNCTPDGQPSIIKRKVTKEE